ncbi:Hint domain-containing protein [Roseinatronobacter sp.]|uniref:Hint domain-containing protein n=1 Tax=Roseinatronobacter sp. TaxID=1945755 RepID=UPI0025FD3D2F|nr:Hint domain-containing protein [Rhodobaca sp.]
MALSTPHSGVFAIEWSATQIDGTAGLDASWLRVGANWQWHGTAIRLDSNQSGLPLFHPVLHRDIREHARAVAQRLSGTIPAPEDVTDIETLPNGAFRLTDGETSYTARIAASGQYFLVVFDRAPPQPGKLCWITHHNPVQRADHAPPQDVICFASDTTITTAQGPKPVARLRVGDLVQTRDNGLQPVLWLGQTTLSGPALRRHPHLRPIRLRRGALQNASPFEDLCVSPAHRIVVSGRKARDLFGCEEVLVRAGDLIDYTTVTQDPALHGVVYMHLLLDAHQIIFANGVATESFHPAMAPAQTLRTHRYDLRQVCESWVVSPESYGPAVRRCLEAGEAALLAA